MVGFLEVHIQVYRCSERFGLTFPTAGGYDAIWVLVCDPESCDPDQSPLERIEHIWNNYKELNVSPLSSKESLAKGIRLESVNDIPGLQNVLDYTPL